LFNGQQDQEEKKIVMIHREKVRLQFMNIKDINLKSNKDHLVALSFAEPVWFTNLIKSITSKVSKNKLAPAKSRHTTTPPRESE